MRPLAFGLGLTLLLLSGCRATLRYPGPLDSLARYAPTERPLPPAASPSETPEGLIIGEDALPSRRQPFPRGNLDAAQRVVQSSAALVDQTRLLVGEEVYRHDCIGMVEAAYAQALELDLTSSIEDLYRQAQVLGIAHGGPLPHPGDVVFFDHSYDKNRNGQRDDPFTHVAVVEHVSEDGTIGMVHLSGRGKPVTRKNMNLLYPDVARGPDGTAWNDGLRSPQDRDGGPELTGQLFLGFGSFWSVSADELAQAAQQVQAAQAQQAEASR